MSKPDHVGIHHAVVVVQRGCRKPVLPRDHPLPTVPDGAATSAGKPLAVRRWRICSFVPLPGRRTQDAGLFVAIAECNQVREAAQVWRRLFAEGQIPARLREIVDLGDVDRSVLADFDTRISETDRASGSQGRTHRNRHSPSIGPAGRLTQPWASPPGTGYGHFGSGW
jgi:hypothetical protein